MKTLIEIVYQIEKRTPASGWEQTTPILKSQSDAETVLESRRIIAREREERIEFRAVETIRSAL